MIGTISKRTMESMNLAITATDEVLDYLVEKGYDKIYGARPLRRTIQNEIEDLIADEFLSGKIKRGDKVELQMTEEKTLTFKRSRSRSRKLVSK
jgi:ATP-dependent Clp protease ATP-binding subunit ClpC